MGVNIGEVEVVLRLLCIVLDIGRLGKEKLLVFIAFSSHFHLISYHLKPFLSDLNSHTVRI